MDPTAADEPRRRPGGRSRRVEEAVTAASLEILSTRGYAALSVREVARRAGVAESTVYRRWPTADHLARAAAISATSPLLDVPDTGELESDLRIVLDRLIEMVLRPEVGRVLRAVAGMEGEDAPTSLARAEFWSGRFEVGAEVFRRAVARGEVSASIDAPSAFEGLIAPVYLRLLLTGGPLGEEFVAGCVARTLAAVGASNPG